MSDLKDEIALRAAIFDAPGTDAEAIKQKEQAITDLSSLYVKTEKAAELRDLLGQLRPFFAVIPKAKTAKIVRSIVDSIAKIPGSTDLQVCNSLQHASCSCGSCCHCDSAWLVAEGISLFWASHA